MREDFARLLPSKETERKRKNGENEENKEKACF